MAMTLVQMAEKILKEEKRALTVWDIWQAAEKKGYDKLVEAKDKTLFDPLGGSIHADMRNNPSSVFVTLGERPTRFILKSQLESIQPGRRVRILEHVIYTIDLGIGAADVVATKGSTGRIVAFDEYSENLKGDSESGALIHSKHLSWVKEKIDSRAGYLIEFDEVVQPSEDDYADWNTHIDKLATSFQVGAIYVIPIESITVI